MVQGRAVTRQADVIREVRRGSMKEPWGMDISYRVLDNCSLEVLVSRVTPGSPVFREGLRAGQVLTTINNWEIEAMQVVEAVETVLLAGGFFITLGWLESSYDSSYSDWKLLGKF